MLNVMFRSLEDDDDMDAGEDEESVEGTMVPNDSDDSDADSSKCHFCKLNYFLCMYVTFVHVYLSGLLISRFLYMVNQYSYP